MRKILFVCTGNVCRSVMAEAYFNEWLRHPSSNKAMEVSSAGIQAVKNFPIPKQVAEIILKRTSQKKQHFPKAVTREDILKSDWIYVMENHHGDFLRRFFPEAAGKIKKLSDYYPHRDEFRSGDDIPDPIGLGSNAFEMVGDIIWSCCGELAKKIKTPFYEVTGKESSETGSASLRTLEIEK